MDNNDLITRINKEVEVFREFIKNVNLITVTFQQICKKTKNIDEIRKNDYSSLSKAKKNKVYIFSIIKRKYCM